MKKINSNPNQQIASEIARKRDLEGAIIAGRECGVALKRRVVVAHTVREQWGGGVIRRSAKAARAAKAYAAARALYASLQPHQGWDWDGEVPPPAL